MESRQDPMPLITFKALAPRINFGQTPGMQPVYQRDSGVWSLEQEQLLMDSVLRGFDIPKIYLRKLTTQPFEYEVIDGQQRIRALTRFMDNEFRLSEDASDLHFQGKTYSIAGKLSSELDHEILN
jgi:uncharacterized protein with ParB-like and HNH nuclease domain